MKICSKCLARNEGQAERCGKCGADLRPLRDLVRFSNIIFLYRIPKPLDKPLSEGGQVDKVCDVYLAKVDSKHPYPFPIFDWDGMVTPNRLEIAVEPLGKEDIDDLIKALPNQVLNELANGLRYAGLLQDGKASPTQIAETYASNRLAYVAVPRLREPEILRSYNWGKDVVDRILSFKVQKDPRIIALQRCHLLRGLNQRINPHSITATNGGTGKTEFYRRVGENIDKTTPISFIGYAKSPKPEDIFYGTIHETELPINIDQIESQTAPQIVRYLFNILESGYAQVSSGAAKFTVSSNSIFNFSANPIGYSKDASKSFSTLLSHLSLNPTFGRRIAIILYGNDFKRIETKPSEDDLKEWDSLIALFRAVEEYCRKTLPSIVKKAWDWLNNEIPNYTETVSKIVKDLEDGSYVKSFILEHTAAQVRIRAGVLYAVLADYLDKIALGDYDLSELLEEAEDRLPYYVQLNIDSIINIAKAWSKEAEYEAESYFSSCPSYVREIISACLHHKKTNVAAITADLELIPYECEDRKNYPYFSIAVANLKKRKKLDVLNNDFKRIFGFQLIKVDSKVLVEYHEIPKAVEKLKLIGRYGSQTSFIDFSKTADQTPKAEDEPKLPMGFTTAKDLYLSSKKCSVCGAIFLSEEDLNNHLRTHQKGE